jgi:NADH-quinone oxidoreductase subunit L
MGAATAAMTAFYMTRLFCLTFLGKPRFDAHHVHPHESPMTMVAPLMVLAVLSAIGGFMGIPGHSLLASWLEPITGAHAESHDVMEYVLMAVSVLIACSGIGLGYYIYVLKPEIPTQVVARTQGLYRLLLNKYFVDEIYNAVFIQPIKKVSYLTWKYFDVLVVDGAVLVLARASKASGEILRLFHTGGLHIYAFWMVAAIMITLGYLVYGIH